MGEIARAMLDGTLCECCGEFIDDDEAGGFPRYCCEDCAKGRGVEPAPRTQSNRARKARYKAAAKPFQCPKQCGKFFRTERGADAHAKDVHE